VDEKGKYERTIDREFLNKFFDVQSIAKERRSLRTWTPAVSFPEVTMQLTGLGGIPPYL
jgi:hypothetical protein